MGKFFAICTIILIWHISAPLLNSNILPPPLNVLLCLKTEWLNILLHSFFSAYRLFGGILAALPFGVAVGVLTGYNKNADSLVSPFVSISASIPKTALLPVIMLFFGIGDFSKIFLLAIIMVFQVIIFVRDSVKSIPKEYYMPLYTVNANTAQIILHITLPATAPAIFSALRNSLATGISALFFAEAFGAGNGIGFYITDMWARLNYPNMYLGITVLAVSGYFLIAFAGFLEKHFNYSYPSNW